MHNNIDIYNKYYDPQNADDVYDPREAGKRVHSMENESEPNIMPLIQRSDRNYYDTNDIYSDNDEGFGTINSMQETYYDDLPHTSIPEIYETGYDSDDEIKLEITDYKNGNQYTHIYSVPFKPTHSKQKRLICFSSINSDDCTYGNNCTYAHSLNEQRIDDERLFIYQIVLDKNLMNFYSPSNPKTDEIYKYLLFITHVCDNCSNNKCTGGYNCRHGICDNSLKICKNDLLTGQCLNKLVNIKIDDNIVDKISNISIARKDQFELSSEYKGCINGHHLTGRNLVPYYKYVHQKESSKKNKYQSVRYIDINPLNRIFNRNHDDDEFCPNYNYDSDESTDEETNSWFQKKSYSDNDDDTF